MSERKSPFSLFGRFKSFRHALTGLHHFAVIERSGWILAVVSVLVVIAGIYVGIAAGHWRWIILSISLVLIAEAFNSAVERLGDAVTSDHNSYVGYAKDLAGAAVLIAVVAAVLIWLTIFIPHMMHR